jgi:hypothetical protein
MSVSPPAIDDIGKASLALLSVNVAHELRSRHRMHTRTADLTGGDTWKGASLFLNYYTNLKYLQKNFIVIAINKNVTTAKM